VNLRLKTEEDAEAQIRAAGIEPFSEKPLEYELRVTGDRQANELLRRLAEAGISVVTFDLREPSLHEIFVEKVGQADGE